VDTCEVVVIGAGLVGAAVAASLADEGLDVAVLEARNVASGATGRTAGLVGSLPVPYVQMIEQYSHETARALWQLTVDNRDRLTAACDRLGVEVERSGSLSLSLDAGGADLLQASADALNADGFEAHFRAQDPLNRGFTAALYHPDSVVVDVVALTEKLLAAYRIPTHTDTEVYQLEQEGDDVRVLAHQRTVKAGTVILAVNAYAPLIDDYFADKIAPMRGHILLTRPLDERIVTTPSHAGPFTFRQTPDNRLLFTAWRPGYVAPAAGPEDEGAEVDLMRFVGCHFSEISGQFTHRWSSVIGASRDGLPLLGALPHLPQVFFAVGFAGYGMGLTFAAADLLTGFIERGTEPTLLSARRLERARP
jgi:glycine/D-amino acid oxidase-like deaminating enzyme